MKLNKLIFLFIIITVIIDSSTSVDLKFPNNFLIGVASSAYQVEGAWNQSGKF